MEIPVRDTPTLQFLKSPNPEFGDVDQLAIKTCMDFMRVAKKAMGTFYNHFDSFGISPGKYSVLMELVALEKVNTASKEGLSPSQIADRVGVTRPTVTGLIDGLVRQAYVERVFDPDDRRRITIHLTQAGRKFLDELLPVQFQRMAAICSDLDAREQESLRALLGEIESATDDLMSELENTAVRSKDDGR